MTHCAGGKGHAPGWLWSAVGMLAAAYILVLCVMTGAIAHDTPEFAALTQDEQNWMGETLTTERSRERLAKDHGFTWHSCCNHGDRVIAKLRSIKGPDGYEDVWQYLKKGDEVFTDEWVRIPNDVIHTEQDFEADSKMKNKMSPQLRAEGVLFIYNGVIACFWAPEEGG